MIYIATHDGDLPTLVIKAKNKKEGKIKAYNCYFPMDNDVLKKDICIIKPIECFSGNEDVTEIPMNG